MTLVFIRIEVKIQMRFWIYMFLLGENLEGLNGSANADKSWVLSATQILV